MAMRTEKGTFMKKVIVIGGGAAGMMAAISAAEDGHDVVLLEQNEKLGKKLYITGKGRCNVTNAGDAEDFFGHVVTNKRFMYSSFYGFTNYAIMDFLEGKGLRLKTERGNRVFPESDKSSDVIKTLQRAMSDTGVKVMLNTKVKTICIDRNSDPEDKASGESGREILRCTGAELENGRKLTADSVIIATGGISYRSTGSNGDGYSMAAKAGIRVKPCIPALVPLVTDEPWIKELQGLSLRNVSVSVWDKSKKLYEEFGEMLFTHFGVSGPCVLSASSFVGELLEKKNLRLSVDLKPALTAEQLDKRILQDFDSIKNRQFRNSLDKLLPQKIIPVVVMKSGINPDKKVNEISREERQALIKTLKQFDLNITGLRGFNEAIITHGGVDVKEINPSTMESKKVKGLYFAGEVLDLDAVTGGYNLQIAWSTGYAAGKGIKDEL